MSKITKKAFAKINLVLKVGNKRVDGKHNVLTILNKIGIYDELSFETNNENKIRIYCDDLDSKEMPLDENNLIYKAIESYFECARFNEGIDVHIKKNIPVKAGLGGGSSDAGVTLQYLDEKYGLVSKDNLWKIASKLGSDVPFFLYNHKTMIGKGTGDVMEECNDINFEQEVYLIKCSEKLSTGYAYSLLDEKLNYNSEKFLESLDKIKYAINVKDNKLVLDSYENDFELIDPNFKRMKDELIEFGASKVMLCGSGPTICVIFKKDANLKAFFDKYKGFYMKTSL